MEEITVTISPNGDTKVSVTGVKGAACKDLTKNIEAALGDVVESQTTPEFKEHATARATHRNRS